MALPANQQSWLSKLMTASRHSLYVIVTSMFLFIIRKWKFLNPQVKISAKVNFSVGPFYPRRLMFPHRLSYQSLKKTSLVSYFVYCYVGVHMCNQRCVIDIDKWYLTFCGVRVPMTTLAEYALEVCIVKKGSQAWKNFLKIWRAKNGKYGSSQFLLGNVWSLFPAFFCPVL